MSFLISGIQQVGIGVRDAERAWKWYRVNFGMDVPVFKDSATASLMTRYTGNEAHARYAILALNMKGGGGFEIWQYTSRQPQPPAFVPQLGDKGIFAVKMKSSDIHRAHKHLQSQGASVLPLQTGPDGRKHFFVTDPDGNLFQIVEHDGWFQDRDFPIGGICGCIIGVTNMTQATKLYQQVLQHNQVLSDTSHVAADFAGIPGGNRSVRRVLLKRSDVGRGAFGELLGGTEVELVEAIDQPVNKIYNNRYWGDLGFIHVCFDVSGMNQLADRCAQEGHPFTVDSRNSFDMGKAAGHFSYIEDKDGTLIEFVETHRVPILAKLGWYLDLRKRQMGKPLPRWMVKAMGLNRVKD